MRKHGGTPSRPDKYVTLAAISPPGVARGRFVRGHQSGLAGPKSPPLFKRGASSRSSQRQRQREPWGASLRPSAPTYYLPTLAPWRLFTGVHAWCVVCVWCPWPLGACSPVCAPGVLCARCPWPLGACSLMCTLGVFCVRCASFVLWLPAIRLGPWCVVCAVCLATWPLFTGVCPLCVLCAVFLATWR